MELDKLISQLKNKGYRITRPREEILSKLIQEDRPLKALELLSNAKADKATVYRNLEFLLGIDVIQEIYFNDGFIRYELKDQPHHHHLVCLSCKKIRPIKLNEIESILEQQEIQLSKNTKFKIVKHSIEFFGLCENCQ